ncbi:MAG: type II toxin-antitoxin system VapC family toxin [Cyanobacteria bacterium J06627_28]
MYLLDANVCVRFMNGTSANVARNFNRCHSKSIVVCSIVRAELLYGARHSRQIEKNLLRVKEFLKPLPSLPFDDACAEEYAKIKSELSRKGNLIGPNDLLIAAIALAHDIILITNDTREFSRVRNLRLEDWQENE